MYIHTYIHTYRHVCVYTCCSSSSRRSFKASKLLLRDRHKMGSSLCKHGFFSYTNFSPFQPWSLSCPRAIWIESFLSSLFTQRKPPSPFASLFHSFTSTSSSTYFVPFLLLISSSMYFGLFSFLPSFGASLVLASEGHSPADPTPTGSAC